MARINFTMYVCLFFQQEMMIIADGLPYGHSGEIIVRDAKEDKLGLETIENMIKKLRSVLPPQS